MGAGILVFIIIVVTAFVSYKGFTNNRFLEDYEFEVDRILVDRQYYRLVTTGFFTRVGCIWDSISLACISLAGWLKWGWAA